MNVPVLDLTRSRQRIAAELDRRWQEVLRRSAFIFGPEVAELEQAFAAFLGVEGCVGLGSGTDALTLSLRALGVAPGDEVILPAFTFAGTAEAVVLAGGRPVLADVEPDTLNLDPNDVQRRLTDRTVGVLTVHLYGCPCNLDALLGLCRQHDLWLVEDAAQAHGARWRDRRVGGFGQLSTWSFYPTKNLGCFGDGGAVTGNDAALLDRVRRIANHGQEGRYHHLEIGTTSRLDSLQAAVLNCRLANLDEDNERRRAIARRYRETLADIADLKFVAEPDLAWSVYHQLTVRTRRRDELQQYLQQQGIGCAVHYPEPLHRQPALAEWVTPELELPVASAAAEQVLCLPAFPELTDQEVETVCAAVRAFFGL